ncbi:SusD/RagB family nutrient-binding outer membrane lipoprotein [Mariniflexile gromovii]|uniref:SusD/RagB family nutrient-binding outer membrane lipoprotein n=1 Tax=Mariniflexile gromovii TaxID=362523 RepID=A0ABS4BS63_9FLAO|nr:SusD/RagB family nutrient-binding outer membrane lipoprotein [Mariniflexile gromovii]MBP0903423.1 SusD/RagB family nutrient-binding outer membrane lipoprotein [Mariniflexile gromovii]
MKNIIRFLFLAILITSCEEDLNINTNPNTPVGADKSFILTAAQGSIARVLGGDLTNLGGFLAQYHTQPGTASQYLEIDTYNMNTDYANRLWNELYAGALNDLEHVKKVSDEENDTGSYLIATLLQTYTYQVLTDLFGSIPYSEALLGAGNINPKPDAGETIYPALIESIDTALAKYNSDSVASTVGTQDIIYSANMSDWVKFANTLKLKMYLRMAYTSQANPTAVNALLAANNFISSDAKFSVYSAIKEENKNNPFYDVQIDRLGDVNNIASLSLLNFYTDNSDPRIDAVYRKNTAGLHRGIDSGDRASVASVLATAFSRPNIKPNTPVYLLTVSESNFLQAEALIRYAGGTGADAKYNAGVLNSFLTYGLTAAQANALTGSGGAYEYVPSATVETAVRQVMVQKWASLAYVNNIEAFFELTRTKYPEIKTFGTQNYTIGNLIVSRNSVLPAGQTPKTLFYPGDEVKRNSNLDQKASLTEKIWWDQK